MGGLNTATIVSARVLTVLCTTLIPVEAVFAQLKVSRYIELAAVMNVAENVCSLSFGPQVAFAAMDAAREMGISVEAAAALADARHSEILTYLNHQGKLDEFCANARAGRLE
jgi:hypothetical protein